MRDPHLGRLPVSATAVSRLPCFFTGCHECRLWRCLPLWTPRSTSICAPPFATFLLLDLADSIPPAYEALTSAQLHVVPDEWCKPSQERYPDTIASRCRTLGYKCRACQSPPEFYGKSFAISPATGRQIRFSTPSLPLPNRNQLSRLLKSLWIHIDWSRPWPRRNVVDHAGRPPVKALGAQSLFHRD